MLRLTPAAHERSPLGAGNRAECVFRKYTEKKAIQESFHFSHIARLAMLACG